MFKFLMSLGCLMASLAGLSGGLLGRNRLAKPTGTSPANASYFDYEMAVLMRR